jgi:hypothetical protein
MQRERFLKNRCAERTACNTSRFMPVTTTAFIKLAEEEHKT